MMKIEKIELKRFGVDFWLNDEVANYRFRLTVNEDVFDIHITQCSKYMYKDIIEKYGIGNYYVYVESFSNKVRGFDFKYINLNNLIETLERSLTPYIGEFKIDGIEKVPDGGYISNG